MADTPISPGFLIAATDPQSGYSRNSLVLMGDSRLAQFFNDPSAKLRRFGGNFLTHALRLSGQRMRVEKSFAVSGQRSDQYASAENIGAALACNSLYLLIGGGVVNDAAQFGNAVDYFTTYVKPAADAWTRTGRVVILMTDTGSGAFPGYSGAVTPAAAMGAIFTYNRQVRDYCRANRGAILFDAAAIVMDPAQPMTVNPAYSGDTLHINLLAGGYTLGKAFADLIKQLAPPCDGLVYSAGQVFANGGNQLFSNPLWLTTTGGTGSGIMTGTVPAGITGVSAPAGSSIVGSVAAGPYGNDLQLAITAGAAGVFKIKCDLVTEMEIVGESYYANCEWDIASGATNFQSAGMWLEVNRGGSTLVADDGIVSAASQALPSVAATFTSETEMLTVPSGTRGWVSVQFVGYFSAAGSATIKLRRVGLWRKRA